MRCNMEYNTEPRRANKRSGRKKRMKKICLNKEKKEIAVLYQEADGVMIYTQGKDRKKQYDEYKKEHTNEEVPKKTRRLYPVT